MPLQFVKYNPAFLDEDELVRNFVVRQTDLDMILEVILENTVQANQHVLVIGPRGSGKTTLALRVVAEIGKKSELQEKWYPIVFSEESYRVSSAADFWLEALSHLADQTGETKWVRAYEEMRSELDDQRLGDRPLWQLLDFADSQNKKILLVVENLNMLFSELHDDNEAWKMRHTLINEPRLMLMATATTRFADIEDPARAMFEMFKIHELRPLNDEESNTIWSLVTGSRLVGEQIRPVRILTGGNARLLAIIAKFGAHRSFHQLLEDLISLIDDHTDYFKSRLDHMPSIERKVYLALAELWRPATAREIGSFARLDVNKTSALLNRLAGRGDVVIESTNRKNKSYRIAEGIYNIYYLMRRHGRPADRVRAAIQFMVAMYGHESAGKLLTEEACRLSPELCRDHYFAYEQLIKEVKDRSVVARIISLTPKNFLDSPYLIEKLKDFIAPISGSDDNQELCVVERNKIETTFDQGVVFIKAGDYQQALQMFEKVVAAADNSDELAGSVDREEGEAAELVARALIFKGYTLEQMSRPEEAIAVYDEVVKRYGNRGEGEGAELVARALVFKGYTLGKMSRPEEAIAIYDEVVKRYCNREEGDLAEQVAMALVFKGYMLGKMSRPEEEIAVYDEVVKRYGNREEGDLAEQVAWALVFKGIMLGEMSRPEEAIAVYDEVVKRYGNREEGGVAGQVARALVNKGFTLRQMSRPEEAIAAYDEVVQRYGNREGEEVVEQVARALNSTAWAIYLQQDLSKLTDAELRVRRALQHAPEDPTYHHTLACILCAQGKGNEALEHTGNYIQNAETVKNTIEEAIELFVALAAAGFSQQALKLLEESPSKSFLEPLAVGLQRFLGMDVKTAPEILAVAEDLVQRIDERKQRLKKSQCASG